MTRLQAGIYFLVGSVALCLSVQPLQAYTLTVNSGSGSGSYSAGTVVSVVANAPPSGQAFNMWVGDPDGFASWDTMKASSSSYTMPACDSELTATYRPTSSPTDWWPYFNIFCMQEFGAEIEPLTYEIPGDVLAFEPDGEWSHVSRNSATIAFETNLPAKTYVEYGLTASYGYVEEVETDRYYYLHICHLKNLTVDQTFHYRFVAEDERGNIISSPDKTFTTATPPNVIWVPGDFPGGAPYNLNTSNKTYLVTEDLVCDYTAFNINNSNITLDLNGHTVVYNQVDYQVSSNYRDTSAIGVRAISRANIKVVNGVIKQGLGYNTADDGSIGYSPIHLDSCSGELAGVSIDYAGPQVSGMRLDASPLVAHHNVILDRGGDVDNRHTSPKAIRAGGDCHHNLVKRHRQIAFSAANNSDYYDNEIYVDSCATNGACIMFYKSVNSSGYGNRLFGTGYLVIGVSTVSSGIQDVMVHDNFIHLQATRPDDRWPEYGPQSGAYCCRITWGGDNTQYYDNVMVTYGRDGGMVRGTWFYAQSNIVDCVYRDNILKAVLENTSSNIQGCVVHVGDSNTNDAPIVYSGNRLISNFCNARMGEDYYGAGCNAEFYDNTFVKEGPSRTDYRTIGVGYGSKRSSGHKFYDSMFEGGAGYNQIRWDGSGTRNFYVGWTLTIETEPYADITIKDIFNSTVFTGQSDDQGKAQALLYQYFHQPSGKTYHTPHVVYVQKGVLSDSKSVTMDAKKTIQMYLEEVYALTVNSGTGDGSYPEGYVVAVSADAPATGSEFVAWIGDTAGVNDVNSASTTVTMPAAAVEITATYTESLYTLTVNSGSGDGSYLYQQIVSIDADAAPSGGEFVAWVGDTAGIADVNDPNTTITMPPANVEITASYQNIYTLTVNSGTGDGVYAAGTVVNIDADPAPSGKFFRVWMGDTAGIADVEAASTTLTMPAGDTEVTAYCTYHGDRNCDGVVGQGDLDIVLEWWGQTVPPADPRADWTGDHIVGQEDLDVVLDDWGKGF